MFVADVPGSPGSLRGCGGAAPAAAAAAQPAAGGQGARLAAGGWVVLDACGAEAVGLGVKRVFTSRSQALDAYTKFQAVLSAATFHQHIGPTWFPSGLRVCDQVHPSWSLGMGSMEG